MTRFFRDYDLLKRSGFFDSEYYLRQYPDVALANTDPLTHYLEIGAEQMRSPSAQFDVADYLRQCAVVGESPRNPLLHYLSVGIQHGLTPTSTINAPVPVDQFHLNIDTPRLEGDCARDPVICGLSVAGWALSPFQTQEIKLLLDGHSRFPVKWGLVRPDAAAYLPQHSGALHSGFTAYIPHSELKPGSHLLTVTLRDVNKNEIHKTFKVEVQTLESMHGPWKIRRDIPPAEAHIRLSCLRERQIDVVFEIYIADEGNADRQLQMRTLDSLKQQAYPNWKIMGSRHEGLKQTGHVEKSGESKFAGAPTMVMRLKQGDVLAADALLSYAEMYGKLSEADLLYSDDRRVNPETQKVEAYFKPQWSPDLLLSQNYIGRSWCADKKLLETAGLESAQLKRLSDYELILQLTHKARRIEHIPNVLLEPALEQDDAPDTALRGLRQFLRQNKPYASAKRSFSPEYFSISRRVSSTPLVSIIIPTCAAHGHIRRCLETLQQKTRYQKYEVICIENTAEHLSIERDWLKKTADKVIRTTQAFNWARFNNIAAQYAQGSCLLFLNDDTEIIQGEWLGLMVEQVLRAEVGVVGPMLLYPDRTIQHAGVMLDNAGRGLHAFRNLPEASPGYFGLAQSQRNVIAVTGACLMTTKQVYSQLGGFDPAHAIINNDLDYCLKVVEAGLSVIYNPQCRLVHHELASRAELPETYDEAAFRQRWKRQVQLGDPYFSPNLSRRFENFTIEVEPVVACYSSNAKLSTNDVRKILIVKLDHLGDCVTALPAFNRLKSEFPQARFSVLAGSYTREFWQMVSGIDEFIEFDVYCARSGDGKIELSAQALDNLHCKLIEKNFDIAIDLRKHPDSREILKLSGAKVLAGYDYLGQFPWLDVSLEWEGDTAQRRKQHQVSIDLECLAEAVAAHVTRGRQARMENVLNVPQALAKKPILNQKKLFEMPVICIHPAAGNAMRQWSPEKFASLIETLLNHGAYHIALLGQHNDRCIASAIVKLIDHSGKIFNLAGELSLEETTYLLSKSILFIGNNSGPHHLAAMLGIPTVGIHSGVVDANEWMPVGKNVLVVKREMSCAPCYKSNVNDCPRALECLHGIDAKSVFNKLEIFLPKINVNSEKKPTSRSGGKKVALKLAVLNEVV